MDGEGGVSATRTEPVTMMIRGFTMVLVLGVSADSRIDEVEDDMTE
jgi:hypothetical protein